MLSSLPNLQKERGFPHPSRKKKLLKFKRESTRCGQIPPSGRHISSLLVEPVGQNSEPFGQPEIPMTYKSLTESKTATIMPS